MSVPDRFRLLWGIHDGNHGQALRRQLRENPIQVFFRNVAPDDQGLLFQDLFVCVKQLFRRGAALVDVQFECREVHFQVVLERRVSGRVLVHDAAVKRGDNLFVIRLDELLEQRG